MSQLLIEGGYPLCGVIDVQGAKNSVLPILSAALMSDGECSVLNFPEITDTYVAIDILRALGAKVVKQQDCITINAKNADGFVEITPLKPSHRVRIQANICEDCRTIVFDY